MRNGKPTAIIMYAVRLGIDVQTREVTESGHDHWCQDPGNWCMADAGTQQLEVNPLSCALGRSDRPLGGTVLSIKGKALVSSDSNLHSLAVKFQASYFIPQPHFSSLQNEVYKTCLHTL